MSAKGKRENIYLTALFAVYMFVYMVSATLVNHGTTGIVPVQRQVSLYYVDQALCALGFAGFAAGRRLVRNPKVGTVLMTVVALVYGAGIMLPFLVRSPGVYQYAAPVTMLCLGILGGVVYFCMAMSLTDSTCMGRVMGVGGAAAVLLQFLLQHRADPSVGISAVLMIGLGIMAWLLYNLRGNWLRDDHPFYETRTAKRSSSLLHSLACTVVITAFLILLCQFYDEKLEILAVQSRSAGANPYSWTRLFVALMYLVIGCIADIGKGKYLPFFTSCAALVSVLVAVLMTSPQAYLLNMSLFYIFLGVMISYYNLAFWKLAPQTRCPQLWAGMGRIMDGAIGFAMGFLHPAGWSVPVLVGGELILLAGILVAMVCKGDLILSPGAREKRECPAAADLLDRFREKYRLTPKESEVLKKLLLTEDGVQAIADSLFISRRVLERHISSIYQKTGTKSRIGLFQMYHSAFFDE